MTVTPAGRSTASTGPPTLPRTRGTTCDTMLPLSPSVFLRMNGNKVAAATATGDPAVIASGRCCGAKITVVKLLKPKDTISRSCCDAIMQQHDQLQRGDEAG